MTSNEPRNLLPRSVPPDPRAEHADPPGHDPLGRGQGEGLRGLQAVAQVIINRVKIGGWYGKTIADVILKPWQFSCHNENDPNREKMLDPLKHGSWAVWLACLQVADQAMKDELPDLVDGATHYFTTGITPPKWAERMTYIRTLGNHKFYKELKP